MDKKHRDYKYSAIMDYNFGNQKLLKVYKKSKIVRICEVGKSQQ